MSHSQFTESGWFLNVNQDLSSFLSFTECSLEGQRTDNHEVQYRTKNKERRSHEIQPPGAQLLLTHPLKWVLCLHKSGGTETVTLLREDNYSCTVWGENTHANSASSGACAAVSREENMLLNTEGPTAACVGLCSECRRAMVTPPVCNPRASGWPPQEQGDSNLIYIHQGSSCSLAPACTRRDFTLAVHQGISGASQKKGTISDVMHFPRAFLSKQRTLRNPGHLWPFLTYVDFHLGNTAGPQAAAPNRECDFAGANALSRM